MRFFTAIIASLALLSSTTSAASLTQTLASSYIVDLSTVDITTQTTLSEIRQYQSVKTDLNMIQTTIQTKQSMMSPFNNTIMYESVQLSGTGGSSLDGPIYEYDATSSSAQTLSGAGRTWSSCNMASLTQRQPDYCTEIVDPNMNKQTYTCGRTMSQTCTLSAVQCRHNSIITPTTYYMLDINNGSIVASMDMMNSTIITYWSNMNTQPTSGQFGDNILLPARTSCPDNNQNFPATYGTSPITPNMATSAPTSSTSNPTSSGSTTQKPTTLPTTRPSSSSSSTGSIQFGAASSSLPTLSALVVILPAVVSAWLRV